MSDVLYRKYRPRSFAEVYGQEMIVKTIQYAFLTERNSHAYLLVGPRGTGKTTLARLMAKAANCQNLVAAGDVCNDCPSCKAIDIGNFPDVIEIDAASNRGIDEIRQLRDSINFLPAEGKKKVYVIDEVHMLTKEAFNALLKTLEEPPSHAMFILATTEPHKVPVTISSRLQRFDLSLASSEQLLAKLRQIVTAEGVEVGDEVLEMIYEHTEGSYRDAESLLGKVLTIAGRDGIVEPAEVSKLLGIASSQLVSDLTEALLRGSRVEAVRCLDLASSRGVDLLQLAKQVANNLRRALQTDDLEVNSQFLKTINGLVQLQADARVMDDVRLLWDVFILNTCSDQVVLANNPAPVNAGPKDSSDHSRLPTATIHSSVLPAKDKMKVSKKEQQPTEKIEVGSQDFNEGDLLARARKQGFKLWTILRGCSFSLLDKTLQVSTMFEYNYKFLQEVKNQVELRKLLAIYGIDQLEVGKVDKMEVQMIDAEEPVEIVEVLVESNADLVESIL